MVAFLEMDDVVTLREQMADEGGQVVLVNKFTVAPEEADQLLAAWTGDAEWMQRQDGFVSTQLHRGVAGSSVFLNMAVWESAAHFRRAFTQPEFQARIAHYPPSAVASPHLFRKVAVAGICTA